jgi:hypothetical protein
MDPRTVETTTTFVLRFRREWTGTESRWRGRIEHLQSGRHSDFLGVEGMLVFLERFGIGAGADPASRETTGGEEALVIDDMGSHEGNEPPTR